MKQTVQATELQFKKNLSKFSLCFKLSNYEEEFQLYHKQHFLKRYKRFSQIVLFLSLILIPIFIYRYITNTRGSRTIQIFKLCANLGLSIFIILDYIFTKYLDKFNKYRFVLSTITIYLFVVINILENNEFDILFIQAIILLYVSRHLYYNFIVAIVCNILASFLQYLIIILFAAVPVNEYALLVLYVIFLSLLLFSVYFTEYAKKKLFFTQKSLMQREKDLENLLDHLPCGILIEGKNGINYKNRVAEELFPPMSSSEKFEVNLIPQEGLKTEEILVEDHEEKAYTKFLNQIKELEIDSKELILMSYKGENGLEQRFEVRKIHEIEFGDQKNSVIVVKDITEAEELQIEKIKQKYKDMFVLSLSHELRTPLNGIIGVSETMETGEMTAEEQKLCAKQITNSGYLLKHLIESVQDLSKIESKTFILHPSNFNPRVLVEKCLGCIESELIMRNLNLEANLGQRDSSIPEEICIDQNRYSEILLSLLINAAKYTYEGDVRINLKYDYENSLLITTIEDTGIGISEDFFPHMFALYGKLKALNGGIHAAINSPVEGIGLGLTISKLIVEVMGGSINVESKEGIGTKITFTVKDENQGYQAKCMRILEESERGEELENSLNNEDYEEMKESVETVNGLECIQARSLRFERERIWPADTHPQIEEEAQRPNEISSLSIKLLNPPIINKKPHILMVDDNGFNLFSLKLLLNQFDVNTQEAKNGLEAIKRFEENQEAVKRGEYEMNYFDLIFMDCNMPIMNGYIATEELKKRMKENKFREIPIVGLTAYDDESNRQLCLQSGMDDVLFKPLSMDNIKITLTHFDII